MTAAVAATTAGSAAVGRRGSVTASAYAGSSA